jgi:hypothetical protein
MFQILETATLLRLLDAAPEAVHHTIEIGQWTGCVWPGHPEWEAHEACIQIRSLALHYFTVRYPAVEAHRYELAAQLLASQACPQGGDQHLDVEPRVQEALFWLWALAGGRRFQTHPGLLCPHSRTPGQSHSQGAIPSPLQPRHWPCWKRCSLRGKRQPNRLRQPSCTPMPMSWLAARYAH